MPDLSNTIAPTKASLATILPHTPLLSSKLTEWEGISLEYFRYPPFQTPEYTYPEHKIAIHTHIPPDLQVERRLNGKFQTDRVFENQVIVVPANVSHQIEWNREVEFLVLSLNPDLMSQSVDESSDPERVELVPFLPKPDPLIHQIGLTLTQELTENGGNDLLYVESLVNCLTVHLLKKYSNLTRRRSLDSEETCSQTASSSAPFRLQLVLEYIHDNLAQNISLTALAAIANLSRSRFSRVFRQGTGLAPHQYLIQARIDRAQQLLRSSRNLSIGDIARQVGFADQSHFTRHFKRIVGITPKVMLQEHSINVPNFSTNVQDLDT